MYRPWPIPGVSTIWKQKSKNNVLVSCKNLKEATIISKEMNLAKKLDVHTPHTVQYTTSRRATHFIDNM